MVEVLFLWGGQAVVGVVPSNTMAYVHELIFMVDIFPVNLADNPC